jgi:hypothetical protein
LFPPVFLAISDRWFSKIEIIEFSQCVADGRCSPLKTTSNFADSSLTSGMEIGSIFRSE